MTDAITAAGLAWLHRTQTAYAAEEDRLTTAIMHVLPVRAWEEAFAEVERRTATFASIRQSSLSAGPHPKLAALESVRQDAMRGYLS